MFKKILTVGLIAFTLQSINSMAALLYRGEIGKSKILMVIDIPFDERNLLSLQSGNSKYFKFGKEGVSFYLYDDDRKEIHLDASFSNRSLILYTDSSQFTDSNRSYEKFEFTNFDPNANEVKGTWTSESGTLKVVLVKLPTPVQKLKK